MATKEINAQGLRGETALSLACARGDLGDSLGKIGLDDVPDLASEDVDSDVPDLVSDEDSDKTLP